MNETKNYIIIALLVAVTAFGWILFRDLSDNSRTINSLRTELEQIRINQQNADAKLGRIESGLTKSIVRTEVIERTVETVAERNDSSKAGLTESESIIRASQSILTDIRATGKETEKN